MSDTANHRLEFAMGHLLRIGVTAAALVVLAGGVLYLKQSPGAVPVYRQFQGAPAEFQSVHGILAGVRRLDSQSLIGLGILILIATPICRVAMGVVGFLFEGDRFYAAVSTVVLLILMYSLMAGR